LQRDTELTEQLELTLG